MARVHLLNVSPGDCSIIEHNSKRLTMIDICGGNLEVRQQAAEAAIRIATESKGVAGNYHMCERPSNPINYMKTNGLRKVFRFILSHPDMDHMDGLDELVRKIGIANFWDTGARREAKFDSFYRYSEDDWKMYERIIAGTQPGVSTAVRQAGNRFAFGNKSDDGVSGGDGLHISAPDKALLNDPNVDDDVNEASYVVTYYSGGGRMVFPGDAHDASWEYALKNHGEDLKNCAFLLAPHHGRDSNRSYDFLDELRPKMTWLGCAPSKHIDYQQWDRRGLPKLMSNQTGSIVLEIGEKFYDIYIENEQFARDSGSPTRAKNKEGFTFYKTIS
jgi:competence protein ComEC